MEGLSTKLFSSNPLPLVIEPQQNVQTLADALELFKKNSSELKQHLLKNGGLLLRGFPVASEHDFAKVIETFGLGKFINYIGGDSPRTKIIEGVYTSTEAPPSIKIPLHNELSFVDHFPKHIYFYCHIAPKEKGETIIGDARKILKDIHQSTKARFESKGITYSSCYYHKSRVMDFINRLQPSHKTWRDVFETDSKTEAEKKCRECNFDYKWNPNDWIQISQKRPATITHPETKEDVWFNQAHLFDFNPKLLGFLRYAAAKVFYIQKHKRLHEVTFADSSKIPLSDLYHIMDVLDKNTVYFSWQKGDVLILDNILTMHGRETFTGKRRVMTAMTG